MDAQPLLCLTAENINIDQNDGPLKLNSTGANYNRTTVNCSAPRLKEMWALSYRSAHQQIATGLSNYSAFSYN